MPPVAHIIRRRHQRKRRHDSDARRSAFWFTLVVAIPLALALSPLLAALGLSLWLYASAASFMPSPQDTVFLNREWGETRFFDESGARLIYAVADPLGDNRRWLALSDLPPQLISATAMAEGADPSPGADGFNPAHALSQVWRYTIGLPLAREGGISGKLARDTLLPLAKSSGLDKSLLEIVLAAESNRIYSPDDLLEWRLNSSYYGQDAFGIDAAAKVYLGKPAARLSLAESAILAAIIEAPALNPIDAQARARERGADLLFRMLDAKLINQTEFDQASSAEIQFLKDDKRRAAIAPEFIVYARKQAVAILSRHGIDGARLIARGGLRVTTSLDLELQGQAECVVRAPLRGSAPAIALDGSPCAAADTDAQPVSGALALIDVNSGKLLSMAGDALAASHQPAIALQPFVYMDAFLRREYTPASMVYDLPQPYPGRSAGLIYAPANPDGSYRGPLNLRDAMAAGLLPPAVQVANSVGMESAIRTAQALGFNSLDASRHDLDLLERGGAVSVIDAAYAYSVLASTGLMRGLPASPIAAGFRSRDPVAILRIDAADGRLLWSYDSDQQAGETVIIEPSAVYMVNDILADAEARASVLPEDAASYSRSRPAALVNGLSADGRGGWTIGYTPDLTLALHRSRADGAPLSREDYNRAGAASIWRLFLDYAHEHRQLPARDWETPAGIEEFLVCEISGLLPATKSHCPTRRELAPAGSQLQRDHFWQTVELNRANGQLATVNTPDELRESKAYFIPPDEIIDWWVENGMPLPPSSYSTDSGAFSARPVRLTAPSEYAYAGSTVEIAAVVTRAGASSWQLEYGAEVNPERWFSIGERQPLDERGEIAATWETALFSGIYTLRLSVTFADGSVETDTRLLTFDNTPPAVKLRSADGASEIRYPAQERVSLLADVSDNLTIERVEFYRDGALLGEDRDWPYGYEYQAQGAGEIGFTAIAYDQVGNRAKSTLEINIVRG